jgi:hypothetical protein
MNIPDISKLSPAQCREIHIKIHYPEFYKYLNDTYKDIAFKEKLYWYFNDITKMPVCKNCGKPVKFTNSKIGYSQYCCVKCSNSSKEKIEKTQQIFNERYGGDAPICNPNVIAKMKATCKKRYGVENCQQNKYIKEKTKQTLIERYGGQGNSSIILKEKYINTCEKRYGVDNPAKSDVIKDKISKSKRNYIIDTHKYIIGYVDSDNLICKCKCPHAECNKCESKDFEIESSLLANRLYHGIEICTKLLPYNSLSSSYELRLCEFLDNHNIEYKRNVRNIISKEIDIYIPSKKLAIEFNGIYHHSDRCKPNNYHINKFNICKESDIKLILIWEDQYLNHKDICESIILSKLGIYSNKIYARKCKLEKISSNIAREFYTNNHIQGFCSATIHYGLYYGKELVSMMSFGKRNLGKNFNRKWELIRYCSKLNTLVIGGVSKLFKRFLNEYTPDSVISWSSNDISDGNMYKALGFEFENSSVSYWYIDKNMNRYHRSGYSKSNLIKKGLIEANDTRSEKEIMKDLGYYKIYDTGQTKWRYSFK